jgi:hypothetical protein
LTLSTAAIHAEGGTVDKFIGDAVMAIWNAPGDEPNHALRACRAAAAIRASMHALPPMSPKHDAVRVRIGINTGVALVGNIGSTARLSYTAIGNVVNLASRLVGVAKDSGVEIVVTDETLGKTHGLFAVRALGPISIRGKLEPVSVYTIDCHPKAIPNSHSQQSRVLRRLSELTVFRLEETRMTAFGAMPANSEASRPLVRNDAAPTSERSCSEAMPPLIGLFVGG